MNHCVPDFDMDDGYSIPTTSSGLARQKKSVMAEDDEIMELLWQNGQVVMQSQNQLRSLKRSQPSKFPIEDAVIPGNQSTPRDIRSSAEDSSATQLFIQEDEMASWLHYPLDDNFDCRDFCADLLYPAPSAPDAPPNLPPDVRTPEVRPPKATTTPPPRPPIPPGRRTEVESRLQNFVHFSRAKTRVESGPSSSNKAGRESTVVDSSDTPAVGPESRVSQVSGGNIGCGTMSCGTAAVATSSGGCRELMTCELTVTSSPGASASASADPMEKPPTEDRKRKAREAAASADDADADADCHSESDKASMLDEAIEYLKSLQLQVQMMSMGCSMVPMMFPGVQQYMPPMGMGMGMGISRPMMPFPSVLAGSALPNPATAAHLGPRFPMPAFHMPPIPAPDPARIQVTNQSDPMLNSLGTQNPNQPRVPNFADPYQRYLGLHQMQVPLPQNQAMAQPSTSRGAENLENHQSGQHKYGRRIEKRRPHISLHLFVCSCFKFFCYDFTVHIHIHFTTLSLSLSLSADMFASAWASFMFLRIICNTGSPRHNMDSRDTLFSESESSFII